MSSRPDEAPSNLAVVPSASSALTLATGGRSLTEMKAWMAELHAFTKAILIEGVDFGAEPGIPDKFLHKPGAEKLLMVYGLSAEFSPIDADTIRDWKAEPPHIQFAFRCTLTHRATGMRAGEGVGVASTWESKYKYRAEWWNRAGEPPAGEGWKKTKNGFRKQTVNPDVSDSINTVMKMALKRAQVDAVLRVTGTSGLFKAELDDTTRAEDEPERPAEDPATTEKIARMIERIATAPRPDALAALAEEIAKDPILSRKNTKAYKNPVRAAYQKRHGELKDAKPADAPAPADASPSTKPKDPKPAEPVLPGTEREPGADEDEDEPEDPGPPA